MRDSTLRRFNTIAPMSRAARMARDQFAQADINGLEAEALRAWYLAFDLFQDEEPNDLPNGIEVGSPMGMMMRAIINRAYALGKAEGKEQAP